MGLRPDLTGRGLGKHFVESILDFLKLNYGSVTVRLNVATFNTRAITTYERCGFLKQKLYEQRTNGRMYEFIEMHLRLPYS